VRAQVGRVPPEQTGVGITTRAARTLFGAWIAALTAAYYVVPGSQVYTWALIGFSGAAVVLLGVRLNRPARRLPWYLIAAALVCFTTGDTVYNLIVALGRVPAFPGVADVFYLLVCPLLTGAFLIFVRGRRPAGRAGRDGLPLRAGLSVREAGLAGRDRHPGPPCTATRLIGRFSG
jgi:hypothetical protein